MRGKGKEYGSRLEIERITPAYAGKSQNGAGCIRAEKDHPRLCGEKIDCFTMLSWSGGSPPPMRGKVFPVPPQILERRITPAYAGKRHLTKFCGTAGEGSPPPMRGKGKMAFSSSRYSRITPAYAGKSLVEFGKTSKVWDHPRLCGEKDERDGKCNLATGSPPPMRGKVWN